MQRLDRLLKLKVEAENVRAKTPKITNIDRRSITVANLNAGSSPEAKLAGNMGIQELGKKILELEEAMTSGNLEIVDGDSGEQVGVSSLKKKTFFANPSRS